VKYNSVRAEPVEACPEPAEVAHYRIDGKRTLFGKETLSFGGHSGKIIQAQKGARYKINEGDRLAELPLSCSQNGIMTCNFVPEAVARFSTGSKNKSTPVHFILAGDDALESHQKTIAYLMILKAFSIHLESFQH